MVVVGADRPGVNPPILLWRAHEGPIVVAAVIEAGHETGRVARIFLGPEGSEEIEEVEAIAGRGLRGDRYFDDGNETHDPAREVTLFSAEGLEDNPPCGHLQRLADKPC